MSENNIFVVMAYRWGSRSNHSYIVGVYDNEQTAKEIADKQTAWRGGKYACTVERTTLNAGDGEYVEVDAKIIYRTSCMNDQRDVQTLTDDDIYKN